MKMRTMLLALSAGLVLSSTAIAGDVNAPALSTKAPAYAYPAKKCGLYYGFDAGGDTGNVSNAAVGTQMTQGFIGLTVGYTCPQGPGFWYIDADFDFHNVNGSQQGLSLFSGPVFLRQRFGFGMPVDQLIAAIPGFSQLQNALPSLNPLPAGVSVTTSNPSFYVATTWDDIGARFMLQNFKEVVFGLDVGLSTKVRLSNGIVMEPYVEYLIPSTAKCIGVSIIGGCFKQKDRIMAGVKTLF